MGIYKNKRFRAYFYAVRLEIYAQRGGKEACEMYEAPSVERVFVESGVLMNNGLLNSGNTGNNGWTENERCIDDILGDLLRK